MTRGFEPTPFRAWRSPIGPWQLLIPVAAGFLLAIWGCGLMSVRQVPDSPSYLNYPLGSLDAALRSQRPPGYPIFLACVVSTLGLAMVPLVQWSLHLGASLGLANELSRWGTVPWRCWGVAAAIAIGCTATANAPIVATDAPAASLGVLTAMLLLRWARRGGCPLDGAAVALAALGAIAMRPAYLFLIPWVAIAGPVLWTMARGLERGVSTNRSAGRAIFWTIWPVMMIVIPLLMWAALRGRLVGDPSLLPFGHQNLAGLTIQWVSDEELLAAPGKSGELAAEIIRGRKRFLESRPPEYVRADPRATMTIESRWDDYTWHVVVPAADRLYPDDTIAAHHAIRDLNRDLLKRFPLRYFRWLLLGARRAAWGIAADLTMHPPFLAAGILMLIWSLWRAITGRKHAAPRVDLGLDALGVIAITYAASSLALVIATSPPIGRFADAAAIFIPACLAGWAIERVTRPADSFEPVDSP